jgi:hypothetical protein
VSADGDWPDHNEVDVGLVEFREQWPEVVP